MKTDYDALGLQYDPPAVRVDRFEEALHIIKQCFTGEQFTYHGEHYRITDYASWPRPVQQPRPPLLIGGGGKRVLSIAAREGDIVGINPNLRAGDGRSGACPTSSSATRTSTSSRRSSPSSPARSRADQSETSANRSGTHAASRSRTSAADWLSRWPFPGSSTRSPWPASICTTLL